MCTLDNLDEVSQSDPLRIYSDIRNLLYREAGLKVDTIDPVNSDNKYSFTGRVAPFSLQLILILVSILILALRLVRLQ